MAIHASLYHCTHYKYERPVTLYPQVIRLRPAPHCRTPIVSYSLKASPEGYFINWQQDPHGNYLARIVYPEKITEFKVEVDVVAEMTVVNPFDFFLEDYAEQFPFAYKSNALRDLEPFMDTSESEGPLFEEYFKQFVGIEKQTVHFLVDLNQRIQQDIGYIVRMEPGVQTPEETLQKRTGSCRDSAWLLVHVLRRLGLAARFASGYLIQLTPDIKSIDGPSGTENDFTDLHAWAEVFLPGAGWVGLDPTSGLLAGEGHIPLACSPHPIGAAPITGGVEPNKTEFDFAMEVKRVREAPRVTYPYDDAAWQRLNALGNEVDRRLQAGDVRLTMGGEPTFVSIDDPDGPEWNVAAVGPGKRRLSEVLLRKMRATYGKGGFTHYGQGKWYPGESLPRWALTCYWRRDGESIWGDPRWLASIDQDYGFKAADAERFSRELCATMGITAEYVEAAYEDIWYYLWKEQKLPVNVDPLESKLSDPEERARLGRVFESGLDNPRGYILPLQQMWQARASGLRWRTGPWCSRQQNIYLLPGDSPIGLRLPIDGLPWVSAANYPYIIHPDPTSPVAPLPPHQAFLRQFEERARALLQSSRRGESTGEFGPRSQPGSSIGGPEDTLAQPEAGGRGRVRSKRTAMPQQEASEAVRTALCIEARNGQLFVFFPPVSSTDAYLELLSAVEATAARLEMPVFIEGERPPPDPRLESFSITPDPGVIEVNIHPSQSWSELVSRTETLYQLARESRLGTEKFMLDGRHCGTGGGNHIVLGAATPLESPFLRRPDLLRSMLAYWHQHPSLSYMFSGLFVGPTSQSPRVDEARNDSLYELELAFREVDKIGEAPPSWLVDRIFRNLLIDVTGNTHRAEFCIDKLYNPDRSSGRLGLLELRSFEMPPHARMSLAQQLLLRALVAWFWERPYNPQRLSRWGTQLHDRWMLPHFVWEDFKEVLTDLGRAGLPFEQLWFQSHREFRFPGYGHITFGETELELRQALEPWHVMGEEGFAGGTVRFVDSSVERLQVRVTHFNADRYIVACNGRKCPLVPTKVEGEFVAGVRYRAWQPPSGLHPTQPVDTPLVFDIIDTWSQRSMAGCTYHVGHPGGRNYDHFPINSYEAEGRRRARFEPIGHTPGQLNRLPEDEINPDFPLTLDLRRNR
ncbi:MAG: transglutaminase family protein [Verrucomicrobiota bacterium JB022]|nr:transglutaminase family protein [Verrucomicrobiota bacterium JB022]